MCVHLEASLQLSAEYGSFLKVPVARDWRNLTCRCCRVHGHGCPLSDGAEGGCGHVAMHRRDRRRRLGPLAKL